MLSIRLLGIVKDVDALLFDQGLNGTDVYTHEIGKSAQFQLAYAWGLFSIFIKPNVSQGDWSRSWTDRDALAKIISNIFNRFAPDENPIPGGISIISDVTSSW